MILELEELLENECRFHNLDLHRKLDRVKRSVQEIWAEPRFLWFTDHGVGHSERLIDILSQIVSHLRTTSKWLSPQELYILLAACYLHDIGMQDFRVAGRGMESFTIKDYNLIRQRHPERSKELILRRSLHRKRDEFKIDLDDNLSYLVPIALISQAHGSKYFEDTVEELMAAPHSPGGRRIRGDLLAALLMIADELDLHEERARFPEEMNLSPVSALHHHAHHYVAEVKVNPGDVSKERRIQLSMNYPANSGAYAEQVMEWLVSKLQKQLRRTALIVEKATDGELRWSRQIDVKMTFDRYEVRRPMPTAAQLELHHELTAIETVDYEEVLQSLQESILKAPKHCVLCLVAEDEQARVQILKWLEANCSHQEIALFRSDLRYEPYSPEDIFDQLCKWLLSIVASPPSNKKSKAGIARTTSGIRLTTQLDKLVEYASGAGFERSAVIILQNLDLAETDTIRWIGRSVLDRLRHYQIPIPVVLTCSQIPKETRKQAKRWAVLTLGNLGVDRIAEHLQTHGFDSEKAQAKAEEIFGTSNGGQPQGVLFAVHRMRMMEAKVIR
jgi:hypothetical protein